MSMFPQKRQVNVAASSKRHHDLSHQHISTMAFGRFKPIECRYMVPGDSFNYDITADIRALSNLPSPTYGQFKMKFRAFFVPLHKLYYNFYEYLSNQFSAVDGQMGDTLFPYTDLAQFYSLFTTTDTTYGSPLVELVTSPASESEWDIKTQNGVTITYYRLTKRGRSVYDFLTSLGFNLPFKLWDATSLELKINIFPLIAFWKFYYDWIVPSRFDNDHDSNIKIFLSIINNIGPSDSPIITADMIADYLIHDLPVSYFEDDIYTTSTYMPFSDQANLQDSFFVPNPSQGNSQVNVLGSESLESENSGSFVSTTSAFNTFSVQTLGKLQDYLNRALIAGNKIKDWLMAEFGLRPSDDALGLSTYLGKKEFTLDIKGVLSTSDTEAQGGVALGSYGGYVNNSTNVQFSYDSKEHGYLFITFELIPRTSYVNALNPEWTMLDRFDFFQPEFDNQQGAVIPYGQLDFKYNAHYDRVFGFNLQYATLKQANDVMSGDFKNRFGLDLKSWFLYRDLPPITGTLGTRIDESFCKVISNYQDWNYIFADTEDDVDHWLTYFYIRNHAMRPMKSIVEGFEPEYMNSNKNVTLTFNGAAN